MKCILKEKKSLYSRSEKLSMVRNACANSDFLKIHEHLSPQTVKKEILAVWAGQWARAQWAVISVQFVYPEP